MISHTTVSIKTYLLTVITISLILLNSTTLANNFHLKASPLSPSNTTITINHDRITSTWFLWHDVNFPDMHCPQLTCSPLTDKRFGACSLVFYMQGNSESDFSNRGKAYIVDFNVDYINQAIVSSNFLPFNTDTVTLEAQPVTDSASTVLDPVLIKYRDRNFILSIKKCSPQHTDFCGVELSYQEDNQWHQLALDLVSERHMFPEVTWLIQGDKLILTGREYFHEKPDPDAGKPHQASRAVIMTKDHWTTLIDDFIDNHRVDSLKSAFTDFSYQYLNWQSTPEITPHAFENYITLQPDIILNEDGSTRMHLRAAELERDTGGYRKAHSIIIAAPDLMGPYKAESLFDNPWTKNTLATFNTDNNPYYLLGNIAPVDSGHKENKDTGARNTLNLYESSTDNNGRFIFKHVDELVSIPASKSHFDADLTYAFFDKNSQYNPEMTHCLFAGTVRTQGVKAIALYWLKKPAHFSR